MTTKTKARKTKAESIPVVGVAVDAIAAELMTFTRSTLHAATVSKTAKAEKRTGYTAAVRAAIVAGTADTFDMAVTRVYNDLQHNVHGVAVELGLKRTKKLPKGMPKNSILFKLPASLTAAVSTLKSAFKYGIALTEATEVEANAQRAYTAIRENVEKARELEAQRDEDPIAKALRMFIEANDKLLARVARLETVTTIEAATKSVSFLYSGLNDAILQQVAAGKPATSKAAKAAKVTKPVTEAAPVAAESIAAAA